MAFKFLERNIYEFVRMQLNPFEKGNPIDGFMSTKDGANLVEFQFPPRCLSDSKKANWDPPKNGDSNLGYESIRLYGGSEARAISLEHEYLVTDRGNSSTTWNINRISSIVKNVKAHFYRPLESRGQSVQFNDNTAPHVLLRLYNQVEISGEYSTWRALSVSITHGEEIIIDNDKSFPLKTKISWELELATKLNYDGSKSGVINTSISGMNNKIRKEWY